MNTLLKYFRIVGCCALCCTAFSGLNAQLDTTRVYLLGGLQSENGSEILQLSDGGYALVGTSGSNESELTDIYVVKLNSDLQCVWNVQLGGLGVDHGNGICENESGELLVCGYSASNDGTGYDVSVYKLSSDGLVLWEHTYGGDNWDFGNGIISHPQGGYMVYGQTYSFGHGGGDGYLLQIDEMGEAMQSWTFGGSGDDSILDVDAEEGRFYLSGYRTPSNSAVHYRSITAIDYSGMVIWNSVLDTPGGESYYVNSILTESLIYAVANSRAEGGYLQGMIVAIHKEDGSLFYNNFEVHNGDFVLNDLSFEGNQLILTGFTNAYGDGNDNGIIAVKDEFGNYVNSITIGAQSLKFNSQLISDGKLFVGVEALHLLTDPSYQAAILVYPDLTFEPASETEWINLGCFTLDVSNNTFLPDDTKYVKIFDLTGRFICDISIEGNQDLSELSSNMLYIKVYYDSWNRVIKSELMGKH